MSDSPAKKLLIVYHSQSGRNEALAYAAHAGALEAEPGIELRLLRAAEAGTRDVLWCDGLMLLFPEYSGSMAGGMKEFVDRIFYPAIERQLTRPYAMLLCTGNDGRNARQLMERVARGIPLSLVSEPLIVRGAPDATAFADAREMAGAMAAGLGLGIF